MNRVDMRLLSLDKRKNTFEEVALGYNKEEMINEANRCLNCKNKPCVSSCPVNIDIPEFIKCLKKDDVNSAYRVISESSLLPGICGRVCPQETQCESSCVRGIKGESVAIGRLERYVADNVSEESFASSITKKNNKKIAVIGSGPSGLSCAGTLAMLGYDVTVFEAMHKFGGVLIYGIPEFRLPKRIVASEIEKLEKLGVRFLKNVVLGKTIDFEDLKKEGFEAIFIGCGAGLPNFMGINGENFNGVYSANEFLTRINLMKANEKNSDTPLKNLGDVLVVGGGNVAMDASRCALRSGAKSVGLVYRRDFSEMPARKEEINHAKEEGVCFDTLTNPVEIIGDDNDNVVGVRCVKMKLGEPDSTGRRRPVEIENSSFIKKADTVIMAIGNNPNPLIRSVKPLIELNKKGCIIVNEKHMTSIPGVFAGGDIVTGAATVILAMQAGKESAYSIDEYLRESK